MKAMVRKKQAAIDVAGLPLVLRLQPAIDLSEDQFFEICQVNQDLRIERNARGELVIMPPAGSATGHRNSEINLQVGTWAKRDGTGLAFDSSAGFTLPNGAVRAPDAAWILRSRWEQIPPDRREKFAPICPDFVLELCSPSDRLEDVQDKMREYLDNGARLGWLLDPATRRIYVYRPDGVVERIEDTETVSGEPVLPGFIFSPRDVW